MRNVNVAILPLLFLSACLPVFSFISASSKPDRGQPVYSFALTEVEIYGMKEETYRRVLHRPYPPWEREISRSHAGKNSEAVTDPQVRRSVSEEGFPLINFNGGPMALGQALEFIAGSAGYRIEWGEGVNTALPVSTTFSDTPVNQAVAAILEPFNYFALVDRKEGVVQVGIKRTVEFETERSVAAGKGENDS